MTLYNRMRHLLKHLFNVFDLFIIYNVAYIDF